MSYYKKNKIRIDDKTKKWQKENPERWREINRNNVRRYTLKLRWELFQRLGWKCVRCGISEPISLLQIDHIHGGGGREIRRLGANHRYYKYLLSLPINELRINYQTLCANCNLIKRFENHESMGKTQKLIK